MEVKAFVRIKWRNIFLLVLFVMMLLTIFVSCKYCFYDRYIDNHKNTIWVSEDQNIVIKVDENSEVSCTISINDQKILCVVYKDDGHTNNNLIIYPFEKEHIQYPDIVNSEKINPDDMVEFYGSKYYLIAPYEFWDLVFTKSSEFTITVTKTTFFEVGQKITFHRVD